MFIDERGQMKLIDNDAAFQLSYMRMLCAVDSLLIPTTQKHVTTRLSNKVRGLVMKQSHKYVFVLHLTKREYMVREVHPSVPSSTGLIIGYRYNPFMTQYVQKMGEAPRAYVNPQILLDYRCYLPGGKEDLGLDYPPKVSPCIHSRDHPPPHTHR